MSCIIVAALGRYLENPSRSLSGLDSRRTPRVRLRSRGPRWAIPRGRPL